MGVSGQRPPQMYSKESNTAAMDFIYNPAKKTIMKKLIDITDEDVITVINTLN
jgi:hypothetical protein